MQVTRAVVVNDMVSEGEGEKRCKTCTPIELMQQAGAVGAATQFEDKGGEEVVKVS